MVSKKHEIISHFTTFMQNYGKTYQEWCVGISNDAFDRLFNHHGVKKDIDFWIHETAISEQVAKEVEEHFVKKLGTDKGSDGKACAKTVYAYKIAPHTRP